MLRRCGCWGRKHIASWSAGSGGAVLLMSNLQIRIIWNKSRAVYDRVYLYMRLSDVLRRTDGVCCITGLWKERCDLEGRLCFDTNSSELDYQQKILELRIVQSVTHGEQVRTRVVLFNCVHKYMHGYNTHVQGTGTCTRYMYNARACTISITHVQYP